MLLHCMHHAFIQCIPQAHDMEEEGIQSQLKLCLSSGTNSVSADVSELHCTAESVIGAALRVSVFVVLILDGNTTQYVTGSVGCCWCSRTSYRHSRSVWALRFRPSKP